MICALCGERIAPGQRTVEHDGRTIHSACDPVTTQYDENVAKAVVGLLLHLASAPAGEVRPEQRCMGRKCWRRAEVEVRVIDETMAAHDCPARLCLPCLSAMDETGAPVDIFRWLSDNRIEANV